MRSLKLGIFVLSLSALVCQAAEYQMLKPGVKQFKAAGGDTKACQQSAKRGGSINSFAALGGDGGTGDSVYHCFGVHDCNDLIAICAKYGGDFTPGKYDPGNGAPSSGQCVYENEC